ncbi:MAG: TIGR04282 family arsenosugar biosynthesis glycosyltransferase [Vicingaceae bacterium]|nr:TIGR04282 family arsenosugar biosynthesis glycosyltransferase [Vicingaceae bacterium]
MSKNLLIIFVKNIILGKVKTRLAKTVGDNKAFEVYKQLVDITEECSKKVKADKHVYFSDVVINGKWIDELKFVQNGENLGERMCNAFDYAFKQGYDKVVLIGSDLPDISPEIIEKGFDALDTGEIVFGPAEDGGYYLVGMKKPHKFIFENKPWSEPNLFNVTLKELGKQEVSFSLLQTLNDIDTFEDLKSSKIYNNVK